MRRIGRGKIFVAIGAAGCILVAAHAAAASEGANPAASLNPRSFPRIGRVDKAFQSYNIEMAEIIGGRFWAPYPKNDGKVETENTMPSGGLSLEASLFRQRPPADLMGNPRLVNMARALGPAYIRVSGSWANNVFFQDDDKPLLAKPPAGFQNVLSRSQWDGVVAFARAVNGKIVTSFAVGPGARDAAGVWSVDQARKLLEYTRRIGGHIYAAELINEPNLGPVSGLPGNYSPASFARDVAVFRSFVKNEAPDLKIVGPGSTGETGVALFANRGMSTEAMLSAEPHALFDIFSYHFYGARSQRCTKMAPSSGIQPEDALSEEWLARTDKALAFYKDLRDRHMAGVPIWLNETAQASCGGDKWAGSFLDSFRYVDQMGRLAKQGVTAVFHNTLAASDYGLIDEATIAPRPNYWAALLWHRLMGDVVLDTGPLRTGLHIYAHCLSGRPGGVALVAINLDRSKTTSLRFPSGTKRYTLSADDVSGNLVQLNGKTLALAGDDLPAIEPVVFSVGGTVMLKPTTISFFAIPSAANAACR